MADELEAIRQRLDMLEAQHAVTVSFVQFLLQALLLEQSEADRPRLRTALEQIFETNIAGLLASEHGFPDISIRAVELMREQMFGKKSG